MNAAARGPLAAALACCLVLAGCGAAPAGPSATPTATPAGETATTAGPSTLATNSTTPPSAPATTPNPTTARTEPTVTVSNGTLPVDASRIFRRVLRLTNASPPDRVTVTVRDDRLDWTDFSWVERPEGPGTFAQRLGIEQKAEATPQWVGIAYADQVYVSPRNRSAQQLELVLAHEFAHVLYRTENFQLRANESMPDRVSRSLVDGAATHVEAAYARQYMAGDVTPVESRASQYRSSTPYQKTIYGPYHFGGRYFALRNVPVNETIDVLGNPPQTMEAIIHGYPPGQDPPEPISVEAQLNGSAWERAPTWQPDRRGQTRGEAFLRAHLSQFLPEERAAEVAAGWGNDTLLTFYDGVPTTDANGSGFVWIHRWDGEADATEFTSAAEPYYQEVDRANTSMAVSRVGPRTTAVLVGPDRFVREVGVDANNGTVVVGARRAVRR